MQYEISKEKSAEFLRQAIRHMSMQDAAFHPVSYAVWYEYSSGEHAHLIDEVNTLIEKEKKLNEKSTAQLFNKHIAHLDADSTKSIVERFNEMVTEMTSSTEKAGQDTSHFRQSLEGWAGEIGQLAPHIVQRMDTLLSDTHHMQQSMHTLQDKLESSLQEVVQLKNEIVKAKQEAMSDGLTGLLNRRGFDLALQQSLESASVHEHTCLIIGDIDFFKRVNDSYGHLFGDKVIQTVAKIMKTVAGDLYTAVRYGGEEFVLLLPHTSLETAREVAETIRHHVANISIKNNITHRLISNITLSLGVTAYQPGETTDSFLNRADQALYLSKAKGRNRVTTLSEELAAA